MKVLILGGASSGKSRLGEELCLSLGKKRGYLATMEPLGEVGAARVNRHRRQRDGKGFTTLECYRDLEECDLGVPYEALLLECVGNLLANEQFRPDCAKDLSEKVLRGIHYMSGRCSHLVIVSNLVFSGAERYSGETKRYLKALGKINLELARQADTVVECVAGLPLILKGELPDKESYSNRR